MRTDNFRPSANVEDDRGADESIAEPHHNHALAIGGAHAAFTAGHIDEKTRDMIIKSARDALKKRKELQVRMAAATPPPAAPRQFGSMAPVPPYRNAPEDKAG